MDGAAPRHQDAGAAQGDLRDDVGALGIPFGGLGHLFFPGQFLGDRLQHGIGDRQAGFLGQRAHPAEFIPFAAQVAGHFEHAVPGPGDSAPDADQFFLGRGGARHQHAVDRFVQDGAAGRETKRAGAQAFLDDGAHLGDLVLGRCFVVGAAFAHHIGADGAVGHMRCDVDGARAFGERVHILGKGLPIPAHAFGECGAGNVLDAFHKSDQPLVLVGFGRRESYTAIAHHDRGDAVPGARRHFGIPGRLAVVMGVDVDEARRDRKAAGVDFLAALCCDGANGRDQAVVDGYVADKGRGAGAIDDRAVADDHVMHIDSPKYFADATTSGLTAALCEVQGSAGRNV